MGHAHNFLNVVIPKRSFKWFWIWKEGKSHYSKAGWEERASISTHLAITPHICRSLHSPFGKPTLITHCFTVPAGWIACSLINDSKRAQCPILWLFFENFTTKKKLKKLIIVMNFNEKKKFVIVIDLELSQLEPSVV